MKRILISLFLIFSIVQINAQNKGHKYDPDLKVTGSGKLPVGWHLRLDKKNADSHDIKLIDKNGTFHFETGPAGIYYNSSQMKEGDFRVEGKFVQLTASKHPEAYGLFFAGKNLKKEDQYYLYFLVRQDGKYLVKERIGNDTPVIINWTANKAVNAKDKNGRTENLLAINIKGGAVYFYCNNSEVAHLSKEKIKSTDGQVGLRINHNLNLDVSGYLVK